ncbi:hypothetical protein V8F20_009462 [Naviculisporaceae sp. PSN 640]
MTAYIHVIQIAAAAVSLVELALGAYWASFSTKILDIPTPSSISFLVFNAIWSLLVIAYLGLAPRFSPRIFHSLVALGLEYITMLFWFADSVALAAAIGTVSCVGMGAWCHAWRAATVFGFINWLLFLALAIIDTKEVLRGGRTTTAAPKPYVGA